MAGGVQVRLAVRNGARREVRMTRPSGGSSGIRLAEGAQLTMTTRQWLEPPTADQRIIWDMYFAAHIMPLVAQADEMGIFTLLETKPLSTKEAAKQLNVSDEWAEILLGALASLQLLRLQDGRFHNG